MKFDVCNQNGCRIAGGVMDAAQSVGEFRVTRELMRQAGSQLLIRFVQPILDIHGYWTSNLYRPEMKLPWTMELKSAASREMPFVVFFNMDGITQAAFMLTNLKDDAVLSAKMSQSDAAFEMEWRVTLCPETEDFSFTADFARRPFPDSVASFRGRVLPQKPHIPAAAWGPVYNTWYAFHATYTIPELEKNAAAAHALGFRTFILDDGWSYGTSKRLNPSTLSEWFSEDGNWSVSAEKLPDFAAHVRRVQALGMNYVLWCSLFMVGNKTELYRRLKANGSILWESDDGSACADPADDIVETFTVSRLLKTFSENGLDGLKVDFVDYVRPDLCQPRGRAAFARIESLVSQVCGIKPDALVEFRQHYATPVMLPLGTSFRANDVPFDFIENLHRCCQLRMILGDGVPVHADPVAFHPEESCVNVARHMISSLAGVPMISADLEHIAPRHKAIIRRFVDFYHRHIQTYQKGHWRICYSMGGVAYFSVETEKEMIGTAVTAVPPLPEDKDVYLANMTSETLALPADSCRDCEGNATSNLPVGGILFRKANKR